MEQVTPHPGRKKLIARISSSANLRCPLINLQPFKTQNIFGSPHPPYPRPPSPSLHHPLPFNPSSDNPHHLPLLAHSLRLRIRLPPPRTIRPSRPHSLDPRPQTLLPHLQTPSIRVYKP